MKLPTWLLPRCATTLRWHFSCRHREDPWVKAEILEEHEGFCWNIFDNMVWFFVDEILFKHVDLVVFQHASLGYFAERFHLGCKSLVFVDFFHEPGVLLRLGGVNWLGPASFSVEHALFACADSSGVDLMDWQVGDVVEFNKIGVSEHVVLVLEVVFGGGVEGGGNGRSVCKLGLPAEFLPGPGVLVELSHEFL